jgi:capsular polysaccharide biosynthesis protein
VSLFGHPDPLDSIRPGSGVHSASFAPRASSAASDPKQALFRIDLRRSLQIHRPLALSIAIVGTLLAVAYFLRSWPTYRAESLIYVQPSPFKVLDVGTQRLPADSAAYESYLAQQVVNVTRADVLAAALHKLKPGEFQLSGESDQTAADRLSHIIQATRTGSYQFTIAATASRPNVAADIANAVTTSYIDTAEKQQKFGNAERLSILRMERDRVQNELAEDHTELRDVAGATAATTRLERSSDLTADITRLQNRYAVVDEQMRNLILEDSAP